MLISAHKDNKKEGTSIVLYRITSHITAINTKD